MPMGLTAAFLASLGWASLDALRKRLAGHVPALALVVWFNLGALPGFVLWTLARGDGLPGPDYLVPGLCSAAFALAAQWLFLEAVRVSGLSTTIPMLSLTPAASAFLAWLLLAEAPTPAQAVGLGLVVVGCLANGVLRAGGGFALDRGAWMMAGVAMLFSANAVVDKLAVSHAGPALHGAVMTSSAVLGLGGFLLLTGRRHQLVVDRAHRLPLAGAMLALITAYSMQLIAFQTVLMSLVEGLKRGLGMALAAVNGRLFFGEDLPWWRVGLIGALVVGVGLVLSG